MSLVRDFGTIVEQYNRVHCTLMMACASTSVLTTAVARYGHVDDYRYGVISKLICGGGAYLAFSVEVGVEC